MTARPATLPIAPRLLPLAGALAAVFLALTPGPAAAAGLGAVLKGSPFEFFTEEDTTQFIAAARALAVEPEAGATRRWANEASGAWGTMGVKRNFRRSGAPCKEIRGENTARARTEPFRLVLCQTAKGEWRIASSGPVKK